MVRRIHDHYNEGRRSGPCDCPNPGAPQPSWRDPDKVTPIAIPVAGPGVTYGEVARRRPPPTCLPGPGEGQGRTTVVTPSINLLPRHDRPAPTSYRDDAGRFHPGPTARGYREHLAAGCWPCLGSLARARDAGEPWALAVEMPATSAYDVTKVSPIAMPIPRPGMPRDQQWHGALVHLRPQHIGPSAVAVGVVAYALASLAWWLAAPLLVAMFTLLIAAERRDWLAIDRTPRARLLRR